MKTEKRYIIMIHYPDAYSHPYKKAFKTREFADEIMRAIAKYNTAAETIWIEEVEI